MYSNKQRIICFVGPDMTGKTNISQELSRQSGISYFKASSERMTFTDEQDRFLQQMKFADPRQLDLLTQVKFSVIMDRGFPCEWAYSRYFKRVTDVNVILDHDKEYARLGTQIVFCYHQNYENYQDDLNPKIAGPALRQIHLYYEEFFKITECQVVRLCVDDCDLPRQIHDLSNDLGLPLNNGNQQKRI